MAVDTLGNLLAIHVTPANEQDRGQVAELAKQGQDITGDNVEVAFVDAGYTGEQAQQDAAHVGIRLQVVKLPDAKLGFVLLPRRWVVARSFGWLAHFRRLARDYERLPETLAALHFLAFAMLLSSRFCALVSAKSLYQALDILKTFAVDVAECRTDEFRNHHNYDLRSVSVESIIHCGVIMKGVTSKATSLYFEFIDMA